MLQLGGDGEEYMTESRKMLRIFRRGSMSHRFARESDRKAAL